MGQAGAVVVTLRGEEYLGFELQPAEGFAVDDPVPVPLVLGTEFAGGNRLFPAGGFGGAGSPGSEL